MSRFSRRHLHPMLLRRRWMIHPAAGVTTEEQARFAMGRTPARTRPESWFPVDEPRASIGFGRVLSDAEVLEWLEAHDVEPRAFFMRAPGGFNGAYRLMEDNEQSFEETVAAARLEAIQNFEISLESHALRSQSFAERYTEGEVSTNGRPSRFGPVVAEYAFSV